MTTSAHASSDSAEHPRTIPDAATVLVLNSGSSSLKFQLLDPTAEEVFASGIVERIGLDNGVARLETGSVTQPFSGEVPNHVVAMEVVMRLFEQAGLSLEEANVVAVGHRVVQGGARFSAPKLIDSWVRDQIKDLGALAPLHNPAAVDGIDAARKLFPAIPHVAVFDTAFFHDLPDEAAPLSAPSSSLPALTREAVEACLRQALVGGRVVVCGTTLAELCAALRGAGAPPNVTIDSSLVDVNSSYSYVLWCHDFADTSIVAEVDGRAVGFVTGYRRPADPSTLMVWQVAVDDDFRGHGIAAKMLHQLFDRVRRSSVVAMHTTISPDNVASQRLFASVARDRGLDFVRRDLFAVDDFPDAHQPEDLYMLEPKVGEP